MHLNTLSSAVIALSAIGSASPVNQKQHFDVEESVTVTVQRVLPDTSPNPIHVNGLFDFIVDLDRRVGTGIINPLVETALGGALGPRFVNSLFKGYTGDSAPHTEASWKCFTTCAPRILTMAPCIAVSAATGNVNALLNCVPNQGEICECASCLPDPVEGLIGSSALCNGRMTDAEVKDIVAAQEPLSLDSFIWFSGLSPVLKAFRGDLLSGDAVEAAKLGACYIGTVVGGDCGCCLGIHVPFGDNKSDGCLGKCIKTAEIGYAKDPSRREEL